MQENETIVINVHKNKNKKDTYSINRCLNGKSKEGYRPVPIELIVSDFSNIIHGFEPERSHSRLVQLSD